MLPCNVLEACIHVHSGCNYFLCNEKERKEKKRKEKKRKEKKRKEDKTGGQIKLN